jgi:preprotein translocase subunit YajC
MITAIGIFVAMPPPSGNGQGMSPVGMVVWMGLMIAIFYVLLIRPQQKREKQRKAMLGEIKTNDRVVFSGGIIGTVTNVKEKVFIIRIADKPVVKIEVARAAVSQVLAKGDAPEEERTT